jgi:hypothetical protein
VIVTHLNLRWEHIARLHADCWHGLESWLLVNHPVFVFNFEGWGSSDRLIGWELGAQFLDLLGYSERCVCFTSAKSLCFLISFHRAHWWGHASPFVGILLLSRWSTYPWLVRPTHSCSMACSRDRFIHDRDLALIMALFDTNADVLRTSADGRFGCVEIVFYFTPTAFLILVLDFINSFLNSCVKHDIIG